MPMTSAARRASRASSSVQQPRAPVRYELGLLDRARCTPVTSCPASAARAAATAESTPPDMAASTRRVVIVLKNTAAFLLAGRARVRAAPSAPDLVSLSSRDCRGRRRHAQSAGRAPGPLHDLADNRAECVDVRLPGSVPEGEPQRAAGPCLV